MLPLVLLLLGVAHAQFGNNFQCTLEVRETVCEGHGYDRKECAALDCCQWDGECHAATDARNGKACCKEPNQCTLRVRESVCEGQGYGEAQCAALECCQWDSGKGECHAATDENNGKACCKKPDCSRGAFDTTRTCEKYGAWCGESACLECSHCKSEDRFGGQCPECPGEVSLCDKVKGVNAGRLWDDIKVKISRSKATSVWMGKKKNRKRHFAGRNEEDSLCDCIDHCENSDLFSYSTKTNRNGETYARCKCWNLPKDPRDNTVRAFSTKSDRMDKYQLGAITTWAKTAIEKSIKKGVREKGVRKG